MKPCQGEWRLESMTALTCFMGTDGFLLRHHRQGADGDGGNREDGFQFVHIVLVWLVDKLHHLSGNGISPVDVLLLAEVAG